MSNFQQESGRLKELLESVIRSPGGYTEWAINRCNKLDKIKSEIDLLLSEVGGRENFHQDSSFAEHVFRFRRQRNNWSHKFCLILHAGDFDLSIAQQNGTEDAEEIAENILSQEDAWRLATAISVLLSDAQICGVVVRGPNTPLIPGFVDYDYSNDEGSDWLLFVALLGELAESIIHIGGFGRQFTRELRWFDMVGLTPRILNIFPSKKIGRHFDNKVWPLLHIAQVVNNTTNFEPQWGQ